MIDFVEGVVAEKLPQAVVIKAGGLGLRLFASTQTLSQLPQTGSTATVYSTMVVKEDEISLYGFFSREERELFQMLIQVSGVGPKLGLNILSSCPVNRLREAISLEDPAPLTAISGIGKKTAQRLILELKDKVGPELAGAGGALGAGGLAGTAGSKTAEALEALMALGYTQGEVGQAFAKLDLRALDTEEIIKQGLKMLARF